MNNEIKSLCAERKWREAIEFVSRIKPGPESGKTKLLSIIGDDIVACLPEREERDELLISIIEGFLQLGDVEHPRAYLLALSRDSVRERFMVPIEESLRARQWGFSGDEP